MQILSISLIPSTKFKSHNLAFFILSMSIFTNIIMSSKSTNKFIPLLLTLIFSGGIMIIYSMITSTSKTQQKSKKKLNPTIMLILFINLLMNLKSPNPLKETSMKLMYSKDPKHIMTITCILLLATLMLKSNSMNTLKPLKSSN